MSVIFGLLPLLIVGGVVWAVVGALRRGPGEPLTLATATAFYANIVMLGALLATLIGVGDAIKVALSAVNVAYSYPIYLARPMCSGPVEKCGPGPPGGYDYGPPSGYLEQQRAQDLVLAITLVVVGVAALVGHHFLFRAVRGLGGGAPIWIVRGRWIALTAVCGVIGLGSAAVAVYTTVSYFLIGPTGAARQPFGDPLGLAIAFLPAWGVAIRLLLRDLRQGGTTRA